MNGCTPPDADFVAGDHGRDYAMVWTPEGYAVHQGLGCTGEIFSGPLGCYHSKENNVTQAIERYQSQVPQRIDFNDEQLKTIASVICVDNAGNLAPPAFVQLFVAACQHTGLDPFLRQIYALNIKGKWTMFVGIDGYRVISERTGLDQGMDGPQWSDDGQTWYDYPSDEPANYCRVGIWRKGGPRAYTAVVSMKTKMNPQSQSWKEDPNGMLAKCAEALARRRAFPADMAVANDITLNLEDSEGVPMTRAEVPEGAYREVDEEPPRQIQKPPAPDTKPVSTNNLQPHVEGFTPVALLAAIEKAHGLPAKQAALGVMTRFFNTSVITKLDEDDKLTYGALLAFRLNDKGHEHELAYTATGRPVCSHCGDEMVGEDETNEEREPVQAGFST